MDIRRRTGRFERGEGPLENSYPLDEAQMLGLLGRLRQIPGGVVWGRRSYWPDGRFVRLSLGLEDEVESPTITVTVTHLSFHVEGYYRAPRAWFTVTSPDIDHTAQLVQAAFGWGQDSEKIVRDAIMETEREWLANPDWAASCLLSDSTRERKRWLFIRGELNFLWPHFPCRCGKSVNKFFDRLDLPRELPQRQGIKEARRLADAVAVCSTGACLARVASRLSNDYFSGRRTWHDLESTLTEEIHQHFADILRSLPALNQEALRRTRADETAALCRELLGNPFRPSIVDPAWLAWNGGTVVHLAQAIYDHPDAECGTLDAARFPILADALLDAGCDDRAVLDHCRQPGRHVRGCWVLDLALNKE